MSARGFITSRRRVAWAVVAAGVASGVGIGPAQGRPLPVGVVARGPAPEPQAGAPRDTIVVAGARYQRGRLHRWLFGANYRHLWAAPVRVPVLDLGSFAGGLEPLEAGGGMQTRSLRFRAGDGHAYRFRSLDKFPELLPERLRHSRLNRAVQDMTSAQHPGAPLMACVLLDAAGIPHARPRLVLLPDDARLGPFRGRFAGLLGYLERRPDTGRPLDGLAHSYAIEGSDEVFALALRSPAHRIDARALLAARLMDLYLGDWDRHRNQWEWALVTDQLPLTWVPVPEDRDHAFARFNGLLPAIARRTAAPQLIRFGERYASLDGMTKNGRRADRWFLGSLSRAEWDSVTRAVRSRLTDAVIDSAIAVLPAAWRADSVFLGRALRARREGLARESHRFYRRLFGEAEVHLTAAAERVSVERRPDGGVAVSAIAREGVSYQRVFDAAETRELRLHLRAGPDTVVVRGAGPARIRIRVLANVGTVVDSSRSGGVLRYASEWRPTTMAVVRY